MSLSSLLRRAGVLALLLSAGSPVVSGAQSAAPLELFEAYAIAREANPMLRAARALAEAVRRREGSSSLVPDPQFQVGVMNASLPGLEVDMPGAMAPSLQLMQMLPFPGKLALGGDIARLESAKARQQAEETWWEVRTRTAMAFYELHEADRRIEVMEETLRLLEDFRRVAQAMYSVGEGRQSDVLRASVEVARMDAEISRMRAMRTSAESRLNAALGRPADTSVPAAASPQLPSALPTRDTLVAWAEATRPAIVEERIGVDQARARRDLAARELWPDLNVSVQYGQRPGEVGTERMGSLMVGFTLPVFAGRRQLEMRREAAAMQQMAEAELAEVRAQVDARIGELLAGLESARTLISLYRSEVLPQADANVSSAYSGYRVGAVDFMTLVDAQMTVNEYREQLHTLFAEYGRLVAELEMTVGREIRASTPMLADR
jgi:outer membrane protein TolC